MPGTGREFDIARSARAIEWLEAELVQNAGALLHAMVKNNGDGTLDSLAAVVISAYLLAKRLGHGFTGLDERVRAKLRANLEQEHEFEQWFGDISEFLQHLRGR